MILQHSTTNPLPTRHESMDYQQFYFNAKKMASILMMKNLKSTGRFPMRKITAEVYEGTITAHMLERWYPRASKLTQNI